MILLLCCCCSRKMEEEADGRKMRRRRSLEAITSTSSWLLLVVMVIRPAGMKSISLSLSIVLLCRRSTVRNNRKCNQIRDGTKSNEDNICSCCCRFDLCPQTDNRSFYLNDAEAGFTHAWTLICSPFKRFIELASLNKFSKKP